MPDDKVAQMRTIVAGAAHGAWYALLVGVIVTTLAWIVAVLMMRLHPEFLETLVGMPSEQLWVMIVQYVGTIKIFLYCWVVFASFLSYWWKALKTAA